MIHTWSWIAWLTAALAALSFTRNPLYLAINLLCILIVFLAQHTTAGSSRRAFPMSFYIILVLIAAGFNALMNHFGETVLFSIPGNVPLISGHVTLEAFVYGAINGLVLTGMFAAFSSLNEALPIRSLIRLIPRAFYPVAVVTSIALTYVPTTLRQFDQVREAQKMRGHRLRGLRDWLPLIMPLFIMGLERALQLAEAMTARGLASSQPASGSSRLKLSMLGGLALLPTGWLLSLHRYTLGIVIILIGFAAIVTALWIAGKATPHTNYQHEPWQIGNIPVLLGAAIVAGGYLFASSQHILYYTTYPRLEIPAFDPWIGLISLGLVTPAFVILLQKN